MTLAEFALLIDGPPKWVLNTAASLGRDLPYTLASARRLSVARELQALGIPITTAYALADEAFRQHAAGINPAVLASSTTSPVTLHVDVDRILSAVHTRLSQVRTMHAPRQRGRARRPVRDPLAAAKAHGIDLSLLTANQRRSHAERLRQLDGMAEFRRNVRRIRERRA